MKKLTWEEFRQKSKSFPGRIMFWRRAADGVEIREGTIEALHWAGDPTIGLVCSFMVLREGERRGLSMAEGVSAVFLDELEDGSIEVPYPAGTFVIKPDPRAEREEMAFSA